MTTAEFDLLRVLLHGAGQVVPREQLFQEVLGREFAVFDRSIDNHVSSLRRKLGARVSGVDRIVGCATSVINTPLPRQASSAGVRSLFIRIFLWFWAATVLRCAVLMRQHVLN